MTVRSFLTATREIEDAITGTVTSSTELRIHYRFSPGTPMTMYARNGDPGDPGSPAEIEFQYAEQETFEGMSITWVRLADDDDLATWAQAYLEDHPDRVYEQLADTAHREDDDYPDDSAQRAQEAREWANERHADYGREDY